LNNEYLNIAETNVTLSPEIETIIPLSVRSQAGTAAVINLYIRKISTSKYLNTVKVNDKEARFNLSKSLYTNIVNRNSTDFELFVMAEKDSSTLIYNGIEYTASMLTMVYLPAEEEGISLNLIVKSEDGTEKIYTIELVRESENTDLEYIKVQGKTVQLDEGSDYTYTVMVKSFITSVYVETKTVAAYSDIRIADNIIERGISQVNVEVESSESEIIPIVITAPDGITVKTYNIVVYKGNNNTNIVLKVNNNTITPDINGIYKTTFKGGTLQAIVDVIAESELATITLNENSNLSTLNTTVNLTNVSNTFNILVTAEDETQKQYTLIIDKTTNIDGQIITENINNIHKANIEVYRTSDNRPE
ncbi:MAG TPA: cadherin-like beta sandwich domain-containing protein, partial [Bacteroidales bacterium]|nr:cadherin-like beta sandwich domain-containing protein [Bacteroidales bacterium]